MDCPGCDHANPPEARFCGGCGERLPLRTACGSCGAENPAEHRFCHSCGASLAPAPASAGPGDAAPSGYTPAHLAERILGQRSALEGERKQVTVVFMDVAGFTSLAEPLDPEVTHGIMDRCFQLVLREVHRFEGTVNQFTGDGVMALFGAPIALEDSPRRAVSAALAVQRAIAPLDEEVRARFGRAFSLRIGIHSGLVVVGKIGDDLRMDYTALGDTTNLAARLQQQASPGSVLVSEVTGQLVSGFFDFEDRGELVVKGRSQPVHALEVVREREVSGRIEAASWLTPYVGRARELAALEAAFEAAKRGAGQVVFLVGEAGIGKSRLVHEFRDRIEAESHVVFDGRCTSYGRNTAFGPVVDGLRRSFGIEDRDDDATALAKIERNEAAQGGGLRWTLPYIRTLLSLPAGTEEEIAALAESDAATRRAETMRALEARFIRAAEARPLVLLIEDLHWIDSASEQVLGFLADFVPGRKALLIFTHRPGYRHPFDDRSYYTRIALQALSGGEMDAMASAILGAGQLPAELQAALIEKADGNPFFVEEVTASLRESGALRVDGESVVLGGPLSGGVIPDRIQDVLMARLDRLDDEPKRALQMASVIGREFAMRLLERIHEENRGVQGVVRELRALELIYEKAAHPELAFMFKHALTHDVAYESVLMERRKTLHRIVGSAIEELYPDRLAEHYEALAHHFDRAEEWERALHYHELAARKAATGYANDSAAAHYRSALEIADRLGEAVSGARRAALGAGLSRVLWLTSDYLAAGDAALLAAGASETEVDRTTHLVTASYVLEWAHDYDRAFGAREEALALARAHGLRGLEAHALCGDLLNRWTTEGLAGATAGYEEKLEGLASGDPVAEAMVFHHLALRADWRGDFELAEALTFKNLERSRAIGLVDLLIFGTWFLGKSTCGCGRYGEAMEHIGQALTLAERVGDRAWTARLLNTYGWVLAEMGCHRESIPYNTRATAMTAEMVELDLVAGAPELWSNAAINLAGDHLALGDVSQARDCLGPILHDVEKGGDPWMRWRYTLHLHNARARIALAEGDPEAALPLLERELEGARQHGAKKIEARSLETRARALVAMDDREGARPLIARAHQIAGAIQYRPAGWRALSLELELARRSGDRDAATRCEHELRTDLRALSRSVKDANLARDFASLGERLVERPLRPPAPR